MNPLPASASPACALPGTAVAQLSPTSNNQPLPPGHWPASVSQFQEITTTMRTMNGAVVEWKAFRSTDTTLRVPRIYRCTIKFAPTDGKIFLYDIGAQGQMRDPQKPNVLWVRVIGDPNAKLFSSAKGGSESPVYVSNGYWQVSPTKWHPRQRTCDLNYRLEIAANAEIECVYANVGWPTDVLLTAAKGGMTPFQDDEGFPPPPFPSLEH